MSDNDDIILPLGSGLGTESSGDMATTPAPGGVPGGIQGLATSSTTKAVGAIPQAAPPAPPGSHAGLVGLIMHGLQGLGAFGRSIATGGREGGVKEVMEENAMEAQQRREQQAFEMQKQEFDLRNKAIVAQTNLLTLNAEKAKLMLPLELQQQANAIDKETVDLYKQAGIDPLFAMNHLPGQSMMEHANGVLTGIQQAGHTSASAVVVPVQTGDSHGQAGATYAFSADALSKLNIPQEAYGPKLNALRTQINGAAGILGENDPSVQRARTIMDTLAKGASVNALQDHQLTTLINGTLLPAVAQKQQQLEFQTKQAELTQKQQAIQAADRPKDLNDAVGRLTQAQKTFQDSPTPENKKAVADAAAAKQEFMRTQVNLQYADAMAKVDAQRKMEDKDLKIVAQELVKPDNLTVMKDVASMRGDQRLRIFAMAKQLDPNFDPGKTQVKANFVKQFTDPNGRESRSIEANSTFLEHAGDLIDVTQKYRTTNIPLLNTPLNEIREKFGDTAVKELEAAINPVRSEYENALKAGFAPQSEEIKAGERLLNPSATPAQIEEAVKTMSHAVIRRTDSINQTWKRQMSSDYPELLSPNALEGAKKVGLGDMAAKYGGTGSGGGAAKFDPSKLPDAK